MTPTKTKHSYHSLTSALHKLITILVTLAMCLGTAHVQADVPPGNTMAPFWVETTLEPSPAITLRWEPWAGATEHRIYRKSRSESTFTAVSPVLPGTDTSWTDSSLTLGAGFDYWIKRTVSDPPEFHQSMTEVWGTHPAGIEIPLTESRGSVLLIVENVHASPLANDLKQFEADLAGDGWTVVRESFETALPNNTDAGYKDQVLALKNLIKSKYTTVVPPLKSVILLGRLPVAYSGFGAAGPDSHGPVTRPADAFFAEMDDVWPDAVTSQSNHWWPPRTQNFPDDGKWDWDLLPDNSSFDLEIGRIDFNDMPAFSSLTEETLRARELLRRYLKKNHSFRFGLKEYPRRALLDTAGRPVDYQSRHQFSSLMGMFGPENFHWPSTFFPELGANAYLWAAADTVACGARCLYGVGGSTRAHSNTGYGFVEDPVRVPFTTLFASWIFDWDIQDSVLRAPLCNEDTLVSVYFGQEANAQPPYYLGDMAIGDTIGYAVKRALHFWRSIRTIDWYVPTWISVMGDPTLRLHVVKPPSNVTAQSSGSSIVLNWTTSPDTVAGYHVYRGATHRGPFSRVSGNSLIAGTSFTDSTPSPTEKVYMVRAVKREVTPSGTYTNASQGAYPALKLAAVSSTATTFQYSISGGVGQEVRVESATTANAATWDTITTVTLTSGSTTLTHNTTEAQRFYRLASDQVPFWSENVIGFMKRIAPPEWSLIANQFNRGNNTIQAILPSAPEGTYLHKYNDSTGNYSFVRFIDGAWEGDLALTFGPGDGGWIVNPTAAPMTVTFMGDVPQGTLANPIPAGSSLQSSMVPQAGQLETDLGYPVSEGDRIEQYNPSTGLYTVSRYVDGEWEGAAPGGPMIGIGESFWINTATPKTWTREFKVTP